MKKSHSSVSVKTRNKMSMAKKGKDPWNKGRTGIYSEETIKKMSHAKKGSTPYNKGESISEEQKIKLSCINRGITAEKFNGFTTAISKAERTKFDDSGVRQQCYENANYRCNIYNCNDKLNAHHLNSWHTHKEERFDINNLVCLSKQAHKTFHRIYGNKNNTKEQYEEFKVLITERQKIKQDLYLIAGAPASGKSWVCNQLTKDFSYVSFDGINKNYHVYELLMNNSKPLLYDPTFKISTFTKRYGHLFNIHWGFIKEDLEVIESRMRQRNGKITDTVVKRIKRISKLSEKAEFIGTSVEVLEYLKKKAPL